MSIETVVRQLSFATSVAAALSITACSPRPQSRVCTDGAGFRIDDQYCRSGRSGGTGYWYYGGSGARAKLGERVSGGSHKAPRGGFGSSAYGSTGG